MIGLIYNEVTKIVAQRRFVVVLVIVTVLAVLSAFAARAVHINGQLGPISADQAVSSGAVNSAQLLFPFLLAVIIGDIVAGEITGGTMKLLLIRPVSRWKIWVSKFAAAFLVSTALVAYCGICSYVAMGASIGFGSWSVPEGGTQDIAASAGSVCLRVYALELASILSVVSFFMLISTLVESGVAAVGLCASFAIFCSIMVTIIKIVAPIAPRIRFFEYAFFGHWQIAGHATDTFPFDNWSIVGSLVVIGVWSLLFVAAGIAVFQLKDVKG